MALSDDQLAALLRKAGVGAGDASYLVAVAHPESGANPAAVQQGQPYATTGWGLWQITPGNSEPKFGINDALLNPQANADAAAAKLKSQGLGAWTTYTGGLYKPYFGAAESAVGHVYGLSSSQVSKLAASAGKGGGGVSAHVGGGTTQPGLIGQTENAFGTVFNFFTGTGNVIGDVASALAGISNNLAKLEAGIAWFFVPSHWVRIFSGLAGGGLVVIGVVTMTRTGRAYTASVAVPGGQSYSVPAAGGQLAPALGILEVTLGAMLLFIAFHNLPDTVQTFPQLLSHLQGKIQGGGAASTAHNTGAHVATA